MWGRPPRRQGHISSFYEPRPTRPDGSAIAVTAIDRRRVPVANVTQTAPGETLAESSTSNIVSNPAAFPAVGGQHQTRLAGVTTIHR
jgi:hypothetical protein